MQKQYFGDITDFYKFFFLKNIVGEYSLGINWCLTSNDGSTDGSNNVKNISLFENIDKTLCCILLSMNFKNIQLKYFKNDTKYYDELLENYFMEYNYELRAFYKLKSQDVIFFDPDNGIEIPSMTLSKRNKFISYRTIATFWNNKNSLIIFQHKDRQKDSLKIKKENLVKCLKCKESDILIVNSKKVYYICLINKKHKNLMKNIKCFCKENEKLGYKIEVV